MLGSEITGVGNKEGEQVTSHSVLGTTGHSLVLLGNIKNNLLVSLGLDFSSFEEKCASSHLFGVVTLDVDNEELLGLFHKGFP